MVWWCSPLSLSLKILGTVFFSSLVQGARTILLSSFAWCYWVPFYASTMTILCWEKISSFILVSLCPTYALNDVDCHNYISYVTHEHSHFTGAKVTLFGKELPEKVWRWAITKRGVIFVSQWNKLHQGLQKIRDALGFHDIYLAVSYIIDEKLSKYTLDDRFPDCDWVINSVTEN